MADIRIKDLTTTASSSASDDFIAIDGTTNGTRKLNAFSPTFGGNVVVTGTLTSNSTLSTAVGLSCQNADITGGYITLRGFGSQDGGLIFLGQSANNNYINSSATAISTAIANTAVVRAQAEGWRVLTTTASTTTSTGALVVSGGLGVGGAASIGGPILVGTSSDVYVSRVGTGILDIRSASSPGTTARLDVTGTTSAGVGFRQSGARDWFISAESNELRVSCLTANSIFAFNSGTPVAMRDSTASTSTSSGALVVSGGVGVAGNVWTGGQVNLAATSVEASTGINFGVANGASRDLVFFGDGTRGGMLRGYHDGSNIARLGFGFWASSGDTYTSVIDITGSATTSSQLVAIAGTASSTSTTSGALTVAGGIGVVGAVNAGTFYGLVDGVTAPGTESGYARIYVDSADGDLKVKFGDGTVKTIATDS